KQHGVRVRDWRQRRVQVVGRASRLRQREDQGRGQRRRARRGSSGDTLATACRCRGQDSNLHGSRLPRDFKSLASTSFATPARPKHTGPSIAARTHASTRRSATRFPRAPPEGRTRVIDGSRPYAALNARRTSRVTFASPFPLPLSPFPSSTRTAPPQPAPLTRAPRAPPRRAAATTTSSSGALHSYRRR